MQIQMIQQSTSCVHVVKDVHASLDACHRRLTALKKERAQSLSQYGPSESHTL